jgi:hypothetical protein
MATDESIRANGAVKQCNKCGAFKPLTAFKLSTLLQGVRYDRCKECFRKQRAEARLARVFQKLYAKAPAPLIATACAPSRSAVWGTPSRPARWPAPRARGAAVVRTSRDITPTTPSRWKSSGCVDPATKRTTARSGACAKLASLAWRAEPWRHTPSTS